MKRNKRICCLVVCVLAGCSSSPSSPQLSGEPHFLFDSKSAQRPQEQELQPKTNENLPPQARGSLRFDEPPSIADLATGKVQPPEPGEVKAELGKATHRWFYGKGFGSTLANVGTVFVFPPYLLYLVGNAALQLGGFEPLYLTDALPEAPRRDVLKVYDKAVSAPGRLNATLAGETFQE